jgi:hypothetical protein
MPEPKEIQELKAQGKIQPGEEGWWPVWGASPMDIKPGDIIGIYGEKDWTFIRDTFQAKSHPLRVGLVDGKDGMEFTLGVLVRIVLFRRGTHNTLSPTCR